MVLSSVLGSIEMGFSMPDLANTYSAVKAGVNMYAFSHALPMIMLPSCTGSSANGAPF